MSTADRPRLQTLWYDGQQPRPQQVQIQIQADQLCLQAADATPRLYPLQSVRWPERMQGGMRQAELPDGGLLQHADGAAWDRWAAASGLQEAPVVGWMQSWRAAGVALGGSLLMLGAFWLWGIPWVSQQLTALVPARMEAEIGRYALTQLESLFLKPSQLPAAEQQALQARFETLLQNEYQAPPGTRLSFYSTPSLGANAFALPGGAVIVTDQLMELLREEPEAVLGVLGHELGHVIHRDGLTLLIRAGLVSGLIAVVLGDASSLMATVPATLASQAYSREAERQADAYAAERLHQLGLPPAAMARFFELLLAEDGEDPNSSADEGFGLPIAISSHPEHRERIRFFKQWRPPAPEALQ